MTAPEWDTTDRVFEMLDAIRGTASDRKLLLFACGCCRLAERTIPGAAYLADRFEKQSAQPLSRDEKWSMLGLVGSALQGDIGPLVGRFLSGGDNEPWQLARNVATLIHTMKPAPQATPESAGFASAEQAAILRELVANPLLAIRFDLRWRTESAMGIARSIDEESAWDRMPILADALQDAGCEEPAILGHLRGDPGVHRRGCWVLEGLLDRP